MVNVDFDVGAVTPAVKQKRATDRHRIYRQKRKAEVAALRSSLAEARAMLQTVGSAAVIAAHRLGV